MMSGPNVALEGSHSDWGHQRFRTRKHSRQNWIKHASSGELACLCFGIVREPQPADAEFTKDLARLGYMPSQQALPLRQPVG